MTLAAVDRERDRISADIADLHAPRAVSGTFAALFLVLGLLIVFATGLLRTDRGQALGDALLSVPQAQECWP